MERNSFLFYRSFYNIINMLPSEDDQNKMLRALVKLGLDDVIDDTLPLEMRMVLTQMQESIRGAKNRYDRAVENGKRGGAPRGNQNARKDKNNQNNPNVNVNDLVNINDKVNDKNTSSDSAPTDGSQSSDDDGWLSGEELMKNVHL